MPVPLSAPTLGGECYNGNWHNYSAYTQNGEFQWAPTLGGECYRQRSFDC